MSNSRKKADEFWSKAKGPTGADYWPLPKDTGSKPYPASPLVLPDHFSSVSAQIGQDHNEEAHQAIKKELISTGFRPVETLGRYGYNELSYLVPHDGSEESKAKINEIGAKFKQHSVIHSSNQHNYFHYTSGERAGQRDPGGHGLSHGGDYEDYYTVLPSGHKFRLNVEPETVSKSDSRRPHYYGKLHGVHVFHSTHDDHADLVGHHIHDPSNDDLNSAVNEAKKKGLGIVVIHGAAPETFRTTISEALGSHKAGKLSKTEVYGPEIDYLAAADINWIRYRNNRANALEKVDFGGGTRKFNSEFHGWITPKGEYKPLGPKEHHNEWMEDNHSMDEYRAVQAGWIKLGSAGLDHIHAAENILNDSKHPANRKLREQVGKSIYEPNLLVTMQHTDWDDPNHTTDIAADTEHFIKHGKMKEKFGKSETDWVFGELSKAFLQPDGGTKTDPVAYAQGISSMPEFLKEWGAKHLAKLPKHSVERLELKGRIIKVRKLDADQYSGWVEYEGGKAHQFDRVTLPELLIQLYSKLEMYGDTSIEEKQPAVEQLDASIVDLKALTKTTEPIFMDPKDFKQEHEHLIQVLQSPSHEDDLDEAKKQKVELEDRVGKKIKSLKNRVKGYLDPDDHAFHNELTDIRYKAIQSIAKKAIQDIEEIAEEPKSVTIPTKELEQTDEAQCEECGSDKTMCDCFSGLSRPQVMVDLKAKVLHIMFKSEWTQDEREAFIEDMKKRAYASLIKKDGE